MDSLLGGREAKMHRLLLKQIPTFAKGIRTKDTPTFTEGEKKTIPTFTEGKDKVYTDVYLRWGQEYTYFY